MDAAGVKKAVAEIRSAGDKQGVGASLRLAREYISANPDNPVLLAALAESLLWTGKLEEATETVARALDLGPKCAEAHAMNASLAVFNGELNIAQRSYEKACELNPNCPDVLLAGMNYHVIRRAPDFSLDCARKLFAQNEHSPRNWSALVAALFEAGEAAEAISLIEGASPFMKGTGSYHTWVCRQYLRNHDLVNGEAAAREAVRLTPESDGAWSALAQCLEFQGKTEEAGSAARKALEINSRCPVSLRTLSSLAAAAGDTETAREYAQLADNAIPALAYFGKLYPVLELVREGLLDEALEMALEAEDGAPEGLRINLNGTILYILQELERWDEVEERLVAMRAFGDINADYYEFLAALLLAKGENEEALRVATEGHKRFPESAELFARWVNCLVATGDVLTLSTVAEQLSTNPPNSPSSCAALVDALDSAGFPDAAKKLLAAGLEKFPESSDLLTLTFAFALESGDFSQWFELDDEAA